MAGQSTRSVHADGSLSELPDVAPAIRPSTTFADSNSDSRRYRRASHETTERFEAVIGSLEGGHAVAYSSGMAAAAAILDHVNPSSIALPEDLYHGVRELVRRKQEQGFLRVVHPDQLSDGDVWWTETPSNPKCLITDLSDVAKRARAVGAVVVCDATFATPVHLNAIGFGIDVVLHAATKAIAGHSDALGGVLVVTTAEEAEELRNEREIVGSVPGSLDVWLALRGVRTLPLRVERATTTAGVVAAWFSEQGITTWYPGLATHPNHDVAMLQMTGMGTVLSIDLGDAARASAFVDALEVFTSATSLGGVESLAEHRILSDPSIEPGLVRLSIGIEDTADLVADVEQACQSLQ